MQARGRRATDGHRRLSTDGVGDTQRVGARNANAGRGWARDRNPQICARNTCFAARALHTGTYNRPPGTNPGWLEGRSDCQDHNAGCKNSSALHQSYVFVPPHEPHTCITRDVHTPPPCVCISTTSSHV